MTETLVEVDIDPRISRIRFNRPDVGNLIKLSMLGSFIEALEAAIAASSDILVMSGAGRDFSVGRDHSEPMPAGMTRRKMGEMILRANDLLTSFDGISVVVLQGRASAFAAGLVVQSDLAIAANTASIGFDEIRHGFAPGLLATYIENYVRPKAALDMMVTGRMMSAFEAQELGFVSRVVPVDELDACVQATVDRLTAIQPNVLRACKAYLREMRPLSMTDRKALALDRMFGPAT